MTTTFSKKVILTILIAILLTLFVLLTQQKNLKNDTANVSAGLVDLSYATRDLAIGVPLQLFYLGTTIAQRSAIDAGTFADGTVSLGTQYTAQLAAIPNNVFLRIILGTLRDTGLDALNLPKNFINMTANVYAPFFKDTELLPLQTPGY